MAEAREPLADALQLQLEAAVDGFDWDDVAAVWDKLAEELDELREASTQSPARRADELGDLLFVVVNLARHLGVDAGQALRGANDKFRRRYAVVLEGRKAWESLDGAQRLDAMEALWQQAKQRGLWR